MLLQKHVDYSLEVMGKLAVPDDVKEQIRIGATVNDLCELTNEGQILINKEDTREKARGKTKLFRHLAVYQSHYGCLSSLHAMSKSAGEPANVTKEELVSWFGFLSDVAEGVTFVAPEQDIADDDVVIKDMFGTIHINYKHIFDTADQSKIKYRALGMMLHLIQDSHTTSHCERNDKGEVAKFYHYKLQNPEKHKAGDDVPDVLRNALMDQCESCVKNILAGKRYDYNHILLLSSEAQNYDGGAFV